MPSALLTITLAALTAKPHRQVIEAGKHEEYMTILCSKSGE
jgi:hypothetical protein